MSITIEFTPWGRFRARQNKTEIRGWLRRVGQAGTEAFRSGMGKYPPASTPGAWPNSRTGLLRSTIKYQVGGGGSFEYNVTIGTGAPYSMFLRSGTTRMARRKMSDNALSEGVRKAGRLGHWAEWVRG